MKKSRDKAVGGGKRRDESTGSELHLVKIGEPLPEEFVDVSSLCNTTQHICTSDKYKPQSEGQLGR